MIAQTLREDGYAVSTAADGETGLHKAMDMEFDAIVLDAMLPKMDGWELLLQLRETKATPVLMLTARDAIPDRIRGLDAGADDYVTKPCDLDELLARLRALIRRSAGHAKPVIEIGEVVIDLASRTVSKAGQPVVLTAREFSLAEFLALRRGEVVSRSVLYEHLLDEEEDTLSNVIDVHVYNLRKKFGPGFITTRRGLGYCME